MPFNLADCDILEKKDIDESHELLKLRMHEGGQIALVLAPKEAQSGAIFAGHNWEELGRHPHLVDEYFKGISSRQEFTRFSVAIRDSIQELLEEGQI